VQSAFFQPAANPWGDGGSPSSRFGPLQPVCDACPERSVVAFVGYDAWKGASDAGWQNNGINAGLNFATKLGAFSDLTGVGFQIGASMGAYDWGGTDYRIARQDQAQPQGSVTYGFFRKANADSRWSAALVQDWMLNSNFGVFSENPTLSQLRGQVAYAISASDEFGLWGAVRTLSDSRNVGGFGPTTWRPVDQLNVFWHHKWAPGGADTSIWVGLPEQSRPGNNGSLGDYQIGIQGNFPLNDRAAVYTLITYMHASAAAGPGFSTKKPGTSPSASLSIPAATPAPTPSPANVGCPNCRWPTTATLRSTRIGCSSARQLMWRLSYNPATIPA
jgi:hypothetical protein